MSEADPNRRYDVGGVMMDRPFKAGRLGHFGVFTDDPPKTTAFYRDLLGFKVTDTLSFGPPEAGMELTFLTYGADHHAMVLLPSAMGARDPFYSKGITVNQISFQVGTLAEVIDAHTLMQERDRDVFRLGRDVPGSNWAVYFRDPDGHMIEVFYGMEQIGWDGRSKPKRAFTERFSEGNANPTLPRMAEREEIAAVEDAGEDMHCGHRAVDPLPPRFDVGGVLLPRPFKIVRTGPIDLFVNDMDTAIAFYRNDMGFTLTEETLCQGERCAFMRSGTDHHVIGLFSLALRDRLGFPSKTTLAGYGIQLGSYRQLQDAVARLKEQGCVFFDVPPELHPGIDYSAHLIDPDGHVIQLYYYMEQIGWDGKPRPQALRPVVREPWPDSIDALSDTYDNRTFQGPLG